MVKPPTGIGLLSVASYSFLVSITQREQVAQIQNRPVYAVTNVAIIPISSQADATRAIAQARKDTAREILSLDSSDDGEDDLPDNEVDRAEAEIGSLPASPTREVHHARGASVGSIAEDVIGKRVRFGRFAANWLSRKNLGLPRPGALEQDAPATATATALASTPAVAQVAESPFDDDASSPSGEALGVKDELPSLQTGVPDGTTESDSDRVKSDQATDLLPKLLRYTRLLFASRNFFFAYDYDLTRSVYTQEARKDLLPLHKVVDPLVCENLMLGYFIIQGLGC